MGKENIYTTIGLYQVPDGEGWRSLAWSWRRRAYPPPSRAPCSTQGNQVAIKYVKNPPSTNFQKPSIVREFAAVMCSPSSERR